MFEEIYKLISKEIEDEICDILTRFLLIEEPERKMKVSPNEWTNKMMKH